MSSKLRFIQHLEENGCHARVVSVDHVAELGEEIRKLHDDDRIADELYEKYSLADFALRPPKSLPRAKSIIVASVPKPIVRTAFRWKGSTFQLVIPPTYTDYIKVDQLVKRLLREGFEPESYRFVKSPLPIKLLAVRSGLALYGRNSVTYVPDHGSFHRLTAFFSDYDSPVDHWGEKRALPLCDKCKACTNACPTGAIAGDRFQIRSDRCLTFLNEKESMHKFPGWVVDSAHNSLIGCMRCQKACPYNRDVVHWHEDRETFTEEETEYLLKGKFSGAKAARIERKLRRLGLDLTIFPRNLDVLLSRQNPS